MPNTTAAHIPQTINCKRISIILRAITKTQIQQKEVGLNLPKNANVLTFDTIFNTKDEPNHKRQSSHNQKQINENAKKTP